MNTTHNFPVQTAFSGIQSSTNDSWYALGVKCYREGGGTVQSQTSAMKWLLKAALNGHAQSAFVLGMLYSVRRDEKKAFRWYRKAARLHHAGAMRRVACAYEYGNGVEADSGKACYWRLRAGLVDDEVCGMETEWSDMMKTA